MGRGATYTCVVGHAIAEADLETQTELQRLDSGAELFICREHGAPVAVSVEPESQPSPDVHRE